jgi:hypothetical protein
MLFATTEGATQMVVLSMRAKQQSPPLYLPRLVQSLQVISLLYYICARSLLATHDDADQHADELKAETDVPNHPQPSPHEGALHVPSGFLAN